MNSSHYGHFTLLGTAVVNNFLQPVQLKQRTSAEAALLDNRLLRDCLGTCANRAVEFTTGAQSRRSSLECRFELVSVC